MILEYPITEKNMYKKNILIASRNCIIEYALWPNLHLPSQKEGSGTSVLIEAILLFQFNFC